MNLKNVSGIAMGVALLSFVSCGKNDSSSKPRPMVDPIVSADGQYKAEFVALNNHVAGDVSGSALVKVDGDNFEVQVKVDGAPSQITHAQHIHLADSCPTLASDVNNDGIIDSAEGFSSYGLILIPLDSDLKTQVEEGSKFPKADFSGNYFYKQKASLSEMMVDLMSKDHTAEYMGKLEKNNLTLEGRHIVIYGAPTDAVLPETVSAMTNQTQHASLPIACGTFVKLQLEETEEGGGNKP
jgi:hypothetical protein